MSIHTSFDSPHVQIAKRLTQTEWTGEWASTDPTGAIYQTTDGGGANGSRGYLALPGENADKFYAESTPYWWTPSTTFDLRDTWAAFYLKEISPITANDRYKPLLFVDGFVPGQGYCGWWLKAPLTVGAGEWAFNQVQLVNDESAWIQYSSGRSLDQVLSTAGFIGVMYNDKSTFRKVNANGILGIDEFTYGLSAPLRTP